MPGPPRKSAEEAKALGTYRRDRHGIPADEFALGFVHRGIPDPPETLGEDAKRKWISVLSECQKVFGYIAYVDLNALERYCSMWQEWYDLGELVQKVGKFQTLQSGKTTKSAEYATWLELSASMLSIEKEYGFTPRSRTGIKLQNKPEEKEEKPKYKL